jgi:inner membrane protein
MPTAVTHAAAGLAVGYVLAPGPMPWPYHAAALALGLLPDLDVIAFRLGIPYGSRYGHRGVSHSLFLAVVVGLAVAVPLAAVVAAPWWRLSLVFAVALASHAVLDALTDGGLGVAFFSPWTDRRYFFPWRPIRVSPIGWGAFSRWGLEALLSEIVWVWVPLGAAVAVVAVSRHTGTS